MNIDQPKKEKDNLSKFGNSFQIKTLSCLMADKKFTEQMFDILDPEYYDKSSNRWICRQVISYWNEYRDTPTLDYFKNQLIKVEDGTLRENIKDSLKQVFRNREATDLDYIKDEFLEFAKNQAMKVAVMESVDMINRGDYEAIRSRVDKALHAGMSKDVGHIYRRDVELRMQKSARKTVTTGHSVLDDVMDGGLGAGELGVFVGSSGCHARGTKILMYDGSTKKVENVDVGDKLMGPDSNPRSVLELKRGHEQMYKITPTKGKPFVVNKNHVLSLKRTTRRYSNRHGEIVNLTVKEYINKSRSFKKRHKLYRAGVSIFENTNKYEYQVDPYLIGLMVGDGCMSGNQFSITTGDDTIKNYVVSEANETHNMSVPAKLDRNGAHYIAISNDYQGNPILDEIKSLSLKGCTSKDKFIPDKFKYGSIEVRQQFLAGLLDADGSLDKGGYDYVTVSNKLACDVEFIVRSLGMAAYKTEKVVGNSMYYRMYISGDTDQIPCKLERKKAPPRKQIKDVRHVGFSVESLEKDEYFGFTLDGDHLYLDETFTVHHNSGKTWMLCSLGAAAMLSGAMVAHYTLELSDTQTGLRYDSILSRRSPTDVKNHKGEIQKIVDQIKGDIAIRQWPARTVSSQSIRAHVQRLETLHRKPDVILIDYADLLKTSSGKNYSGNSYDRLGEIYVDLRAMATELDVPVWTVSQTNRDGNSADIIGAELIADSYQKIMHSDFVGSIARTASDKQSDVARIHVMKNRFGEDGITYPAIVSCENGHIELFERDSDQAEQLVRRMEQQRADEKNRHLSRLVEDFQNGKLGPREQIDTM